MRYILTITFVAISFFSIAQGEIEFVESSYDFGKVKMEDGKISHEFKFVNTGTDSVKVTYVKASCGCTTPYWTKDMIAPGDTGVIAAQYNPVNRPGSFNKRLTVSSTAANSRTYLYIKGNVDPKPRTVYEEYPTAIGNTRFERKSINLGKVSTEKPVSHTFEIYVDSDSAIEITGVTVPDYVRLSYPKTLEPRQRVKIGLTYDPEKRDNLGYNSDNIRIETNETEDNIKDLNILVTIEEFFPPMTPEELANAPRVSLNENAFNFGKVKQGTVLEQSFELTNTGLEKLEIRKIVSNCSCVTIKNKKTKVNPGKSITIDAKFDTADKKGRQFKTITIFTNDPQKSIETVALRAEVYE